MTLDKLLVTLEEAGFHRLTRRNNNLMACCPAHEETKPSWGISITEPHFHGCFSCGFKGSLRSLLLGHLKWDAERVNQLLGHEFGPNEFVTLDDDTTDSKVIHYIEDESVMYPYGLSLEVMRYMKRRGVGLRTQRKAGLCFHHKDNRVLFPWYADDKFLGATGRTLSPNPAEAKIVVYFGLRKGRFLYIPLRSLDPTKPIILVEGETDALKVVEAGYSNVAALSFGSFTKHQRALLKALSPPELVCFFDNDDTGKRLTKEVSNAFQLVRSMSISKIEWPSNFTRKLDPAMLKPQAIRLLYHARVPTEDAFSLA